MHIAILAPSHKSFISELLPSIEIGDLPDGYAGAPLIGTLVKGFLNENHVVTAITTSPSWDGDYEVKIYSHDNFTWIVVPSRPNAFRLNQQKLGRMLDFFSVEQKKMLELLKLVRPDFIHAHWSYEFAGVAVNSGIPYLVTVHDNALKVLRYSKNLYRLMRLIMSEKILRTVTHASTVSPYMFDYVRKRCPVVKIIPNPTVIHLDINVVNDLISAKIKTLQNPRILMIINGWDVRKNGKVGLLAFQEIQKSITGASLHLYGSGSEINGLANKDVDSLKIQNVFFHGSVSHEQLLEAIKQSHLLIHPALEESFGVVLIEAMSFGLPVIGGENSGAVSWVVNQTQLVVNVREPEQVAIKMCQVLTNAKFYKKVSINCYKNVSDRFSSKVVISSYLDYIYQILAHN